MAIPGFARGFGLLALGMLALVVRNADPLLQPVLYAEDGSWLALALTNGWGYALVHARPDYFVWGNLALLATAAGISNLVCGSPLACAAQTTAIVSYAFYAFLPLAGFLVTRKLLPLHIRWVLWGALLFLPLGASANEMIGRLSNVGFHFVYLSALLLFWRAQLHGWHLRGADTALVLCMGTNPVCIALVASWATLTLFKHPSQWRKLLDNQAWLMIGCIVLVGAFAFRQAAFAADPTAHGQLQNGVELLLARTLLFPLLFPIYPLLSDISVATAALVFTCVWWASCRQLDADFAVPGNDSIRSLQRLVQILLLALILFSAALFLSRTQMLSGIQNYQSTYPDRYFSGHNLIVVFLIVAATGSGLTHKNRWLRWSSAFLLAALVLAYAVSWRSLADGGQPATRVAISGTAQQTLCMSALLRKQPLGRVTPLHMHTDMPIPIGLPSAELLRATQGKTCDHVWTSFFPSDSNWNNGIARQGATFLLPTTTAYQGVWHPGQQIEIFPDDRRQILAVEPAGTFLRVHLSGATLESPSVPHLLSVSHLVSQPSHSDSALPVTFKVWAWGQKQHWVRGVSLLEAGFLVPNSPVNRQTFTVGKHVLLANGDERVVKQTQPVAHLLRVMLSGSALDPDQTGFPHRIQLRQ